jgi:LuxR family transcriptional regulator, transcriptional regulator of spore coat protein
MNLTERELQILDLIGKEYTSDRIAQYLHITASTVETHRRNLFKKMGVTSVVGLIKEALKLGLMKI